MCSNALERLAPFFFLLFTEGCTFSSSSFAIFSTRSARPDLSCPPIFWFACSKDRMSTLQTRRASAIFRLDANGDLSQFGCLLTHGLFEGHKRLFEVFELLHCLRVLEHQVLQRRLQTTPKSVSAQRPGAYTHTHTHKHTHTHTLTPHPCAVATRRQVADAGTLTSSRLMLSIWLRGTSP
jgi:hypothetical protein